MQWEWLYVCTDMDNDFFNLSAFLKQSFSTEYVACEADVITIKRLRRFFKRRLSSNLYMILDLLEQCAKTFKDNWAAKVSTCFSQMFPQHPIWPTLVSSRNRTAGRSGRQNTCVWQTCHCYFLRILSWSSLNNNVFWSLPKDPFKGK